jgi:hypothetical protein
VPDAPVRPAACQAAEDLAGVALAAEALLGRQVRERLVVGLGAAQPQRHAVLGHDLGAGRDAGLAAVLLSQDVDGDL